MKLISLTTLLSLLVTISNAQTNKNINLTKTKDELFLLGFNRSIHGTGDIRGFSINMEYKRQLKNRLSLSAGITTTVHDKTDRYFTMVPNGTELNNSLRYNTTGIQLETKLWLDLVKTTKIRFAFSFGVIGRYQTSTIPDESVTYFPIVTGIPVPLTAFIHKSPQRTFAVGGIGNIHFSHAITNKISLGIQAGLQLDTNGDILSQSGLFIAYKLPKL